MELKCLFWNVQKHPEYVNIFLGDNSYLDVDLLFLAEAGEEVVEIPNWQHILFKENTYGNSLAVYLKQGTPVLTKNLFIENPTEHPSFCNKAAGFRCLHFSLAADYLFFLIHLPSLSTRDRETALAYAIDLNKAIREVEDKFYKVKNRTEPLSIIIGDFNVNPYDSVMINPLAFNAPYDLESFDDGANEAEYNTKTTTRVLGYGIEHPLFYNKTWQLLGLANQSLDHSQGTYIQSDNRTDPNSFKDDLLRRKCNFLDQVLVRPYLIPNFESGDFKVYPTTLSDHFPIFFSFKNLILSPTQDFFH